jgi:segregation and condensation protein A
MPDPSELAAPGEAGTAGNLANAGNPNSGNPDSLMLRLEGFEGPLDLLLTLARTQKLDLAGISILALVDQYLAVIEGARHVRLELAADWLVMAAWLTWLKSRLLLPAGPDEADEGAHASEVLAQRLRELEAVRAGAAWLSDRPALGWDVFARGAPEDHRVFDRSGVRLDQVTFIRAYTEARRRGQATPVYRPRPLTLWTVQDALRRLSAMLGALPGWAGLDAFLPDGLAGPTERRAALASTLLAGLELARGGALELHQESAFTPILIRTGRPPAAANPEAPAQSTMLPSTMLGNGA